MPISRLGQVNNAGDAKATFLKVASSEIIAAYDETNVMDALHTTRAIEHGKSAAFPITWKIDAAYHVPGTALLGSQRMNKNEIVINVDEQLISDVLIANIDEAMSHVDYRSEYTRQNGMALARAKDKRLLQTAILAARAPSIVTGRPGGSTIVQANARVDGALLAAAIRSAAVAMDEKDIPETDRSVVLKPAQVHLLASIKDLISKDLGGDGEISTGRIGKIDGVAVVKSNNVPTTVVAAATGENNTYGGTFTNTVGVVLHRSAVGTVKLRDLTIQMTGNDFEVQNQATLLVGKYLQGHGILDAACAVEIAVA